MELNRTYDVDKSVYVAIEISSLGKQLNKISTQIETTWNTAKRRMLTARIPFDDTLQGAIFFNGDGKRVETLKGALSDLMEGFLNSAINLMKSQTSIPQEDLGRPIEKNEEARQIGVEVVKPAIQKILTKNK